MPCASSVLTELCSRGPPPCWLPRPAAQRYIGRPSERPVLLESLGPGRGPRRSRGLDGSPSCLRVSESALPVVSLVGTGGSTGGEPEAGSRPPPTHCLSPGPHPRLRVPAPSACWSEEVPWGPRGGHSVRMAGPRAALAPGGAGWPRSPRLSSSIGPRRGPRDGRKGATLVCEGASQPADGLRLPCLTYSQVDDTSHPASLGGPVSPGDRGRCSGNTWPSDGARHGPANPSPPLLCPRTWPCT